MRNRKRERLESIDILINISTDLTEKASHAKSNVEFETYIKCAELIQSYASELMIKELQNVD